MTAVHLLNRSPTKALDCKTPYEAWHGCKTVVSHLRVFGCLPFTKELNQVAKLDDQSTPRILNPATQRVCISRDAMLDKGRGWI
jgi:hypothetical protein